MSDLDGTQVVVVGGGFGGLSAACYLADAGADVRVLEKNEQFGGRASRLETEGFKFDMGPSWYLMPDVFERFFAKFDKQPSDYYELEQLDPHYRIFFKDGDSCDARGDHEYMRDLFESYEPGASEAFDKYLETSQRHYETAMEKFVYEDRSQLRDWIDPDVMRAAPIGLRLIGSMQSHVENYFDHPKLQQIMQYTLVFLGGAPHNTDAMVDLGEELGVTYETDSEVTGISRSYDGFVVETADDVSRPDRVVVNADYAHAERELLPEHERQYDDDYWESRTYAPSAFLIYLGVEGDVEELAHHTLVLPTDWDEHFEQIFDAPGWPEDPAYYVCVPSKTD
ncbi:phytoene desaturase, partial [Halobacteriales archaeon QH_2_66_30]